MIDQDETLELISVAESLSQRTLDIYTIAEIGLADLGTLSRDKVAISVVNVCC
jgi:hypothetical protein